MSAEAKAVTSPEHPFTLDASDPRFYAQENAADAYAWIHANAPLYWCEAEHTEPFWNVCRDDLIQTVGKDFARYSSHEGIWLGNRFQTERDGSELPDDPRFPLAGAHTMPPEDHQRMRRSVNAHMIARDTAEKWEARFHEIVDKSMAELEPGQEFDLVHWTHRVPYVVTTTLFGLGMERETDFARWVQTIIAALDPGPEMDWTPLIDMLDFLDEQIADRNAHPRDDLVSQLTGDMTDDEVRSWLWLIFTGGVETTGNLLAGGTHLLLTHPEEKQKLLDDPSRWSDAVSEMLRMISPSRCVKRVTMEDHELGGHEVREGQAVLMNYKVANLDPGLYPEPMRFDLDRRPSQMVAFGNGPHRCPGNVIARLEIRIAFQRLFERFPNLELAGDIVVRPTLSTVVIDSLPVVLKD